MENTTQEHNPQTPTPTPKRTSGSKEPFFGVIILIIMIILIVGFIGGLGWAGYRGWKVSQEKSTEPSISTLTKEKPAETPAPKEETKTPATTNNENKDTSAPSTTPSPEIITKAKGADIKVLNGGAAKGSAGVVGDALKKEGYTKITVGNTVSDYTGTVVYYASGLDKEADAVKMSILKSYPQATTKPADTTNKETTAASITIILGK